MLIEDLTPYRIIDISVGDNHCLALSDDHQVSETLYIFIALQNFWNVIRCLLGEPTQWDNAVKATLPAL